MFVRISTIIGDPARVGEGITYMRDEVLPRVLKLPGSMSLMVWVDRPSGQLVAGAVWTDRQSLEASSAPTATFRQNLAQRIGGDPTVEIFEVASRHRVSAAQPGCWSRAIRLDVAVNDIDRLVWHYESTSLPSLQEHDGLVAAAMGVNHDDGKAVVMATFASRQALDASRTASQERRDKATSDVPSATVTSVLEMELAVGGSNEPT